MSVSDEQKVCSPGSCLSSSSPSLRLQGWDRVMLARPRGPSCKQASLRANLGFRTLRGFSLHQVPCAAHSSSSLQPVCAPCGERHRPSRVKGTGAPGAVPPPCQLRHGDHTCRKADEPHKVAAEALAWGWCRDNKVTHRLASFCLFIRFQEIVTKSRLCPDDRC